MLKTVEAEAVLGQVVLVLLVWLWHLLHGNFLALTPNKHIRQRSRLLLRNNQMQLHPKV
ncbi:Uncharacterised protein [Acinetobacter baumannii]|nr:Uncharacterised protein [Acinetobacter baumannii]